MQKKEHDYTITFNCCIIKLVKYEKEKDNNPKCSHFDEWNKHFKKNTFKFLSTNISVNLMHQLKYESSFFYYHCTLQIIA